MRSRRVIQLILSEDVLIPTDAPQFSIAGSKTVLNIKSDTGLFNPNASVILADPFLFVKGDTLYLFYEHLTKWFGTGRICMRSTKDLEIWTEEVDVLVEPFHLSFPFVFEENGKVHRGDPAWKTFCSKRSAGWPAMPSSDTP